MKLLVLLFLSIIPWKKEFVKEDELKNIPGYYLHNYDDCFYYKDPLKGNPFIMLAAEERFLYIGNSVQVLVGYYQYDKLIKKETLFIEPDGKYLFITDKKDVEEIINHLTNCGSVRFVIQLKNGKEFDVTVPKNEKLSRSLNFI